MERITVVKIGGNVLDDPEALDRFVRDFAALGGAKILVHGGGKLATRLAGQLGFVRVPQTPAHTGSGQSPVILRRVLKEP